MKLSLLVLPVALTSCVSIGPKYEVPKTPQSAAYKEVGPPSSPLVPAQPQDDRIKGNFWEVFGDAELNNLENQVTASNQTLAASYAAFVEARALVKQASASYSPTLSLAPSISTQSGQSTQTPALGTTRAAATRFTQYAVPLDATWAPDLWGKIQHTIDARVADAQLSAADLENQRLLQHAQLAVDYYQLRAQDSQQILLNETVKAYQETLTLTTALNTTGIDSDEAVVEAETQLLQAKAQAIDLGIARAKYEHAIALLVGQPPSAFSLPARGLTTVPPKVPSSVPSKLLQRRPDIATAERSVAAANAQIGIAMAAYYPDLSLTGGIGYGGNSLVGLTKLPTLFWSVGAGLAETLWDGGLRAATVEQYQALYQQTVANYRQSVLVAFGQVEDSLAELRILGDEVKQQDAAVASAKRYATIAMARYRLGIDPYLNVVTAQTSLLTAQRAQITLAMQQLTASVALIEALGGGWDVKQLPSEKDLRDAKAEDDHFAH